MDHIEELSDGQIEDACEAAFRNAVDLLDEADILRAHGKCARAYFLAHIACEELGKLPILIPAAVSRRRGIQVDWKRIDRLLRSHERKIKQVLFMDSMMGQKSLQEQDQNYEEDIERLPTYIDLKNSSLYSFQIDGEFHRPSEMLTCEFFDSFQGLARSRLRAFEAMYLRPFRRAGGLSQFLTGPAFDRALEIIEGMMGSEGRAAFEEYAETGDEFSIRALFNRLLEPPADVSDESY